MTMANDNTTELLAEIDALRRQRETTRMDVVAGPRLGASSGEPSPQLFRSVFERSPLGIAVVSNDWLLPLLLSRLGTWLITHPGNHCYTLHRL